MSFEEFKNITTEGGIQIDYLNNEIIEIFKNSGLRDLRVPWLFTELNTNSLLFIGCNPSFYGDTTNHKSFIAKEFNMNSEEIEEFDKFDYLEKYKKYHLRLFQQWRFSLNNDEKFTAYFSKFSEICKNIDKQLKWEHIDLFFIRETNQNNVKKLMDSYPEFFEKQLSLNIELMKELNPKIMVVANAFASRILKEKLKPQFNNDTGTYEYLVKGRTVPLFFSGMLSGQHALDLGSLERLQWHLKNVYDRLYSKSNSNSC